VLLRRSLLPLLPAVLTAKVSTGDTRWWSPLGSDANRQFWSVRDPRLCTTQGHSVAAMDNCATLALAEKLRAQSAVRGVLIQVSEGCGPPPNRCRGQGMSTSAAVWVTPGASHSVSPGLRVHAG
jgi:hypothetical protein